MTHTFWFSPVAKRINADQTLQTAMSHQASCHLQVDKNYLRFVLITHFKVSIFIYTLFSKVKKLHDIYDVKTI